MINSIVPICILVQYSICMIVLEIIDNDIKSIERYEYDDKKG